MNKIRNLHNFKKLQIHNGDGSLSDSNSDVQEEAMCSNFNSSDPDNVNNKIP